jgi:hypothetical protein
MVFDCLSQLLDYGYAMRHQETWFAKFKKLADHISGYYSLAAASGRSNTREKTLAGVNKGLIRKGLLVFSKLHLAVALQ